VLVPVDVRRPAEAGMPGNHVVASPVGLPCDDPDPARRLETIVRVTRLAKGRRQALRALVGGLPSWAGRAIERRYARRPVPITAAHVAVRREWSFLGHRVSRVQPITFLAPTCPVTVLACAYEGVADVCFAGNAALPGIERLGEMWSRAVDELAAAVIPAAGGDGPGREADAPSRRSGAAGRAAG
jgi:hypothetical protein